jgi:hypothetical protein
MARLVIGLLVGLVVGAAAVFYLFVAVPKAVIAPGTPVSPPDAAGQPAGTARITLRQEFFNDVMTSIFRDMKPPTFPLSLTGEPTAPGQACPSEITILQEGSGVRTAVRFENNTLSAPLAFSGSYNSVFGCFQFTGWAETNMDLRYDASTQSVFGQLNVKTVNLDGVNPLVVGLLTPLVQSTLNGRVNPILIVDGRQIGVKVPVAATNSNLQATVSDIRAEVKENALYLYVIYDFRGAPIVPPQ